MTAAHEPPASLPTVLITGTVGVGKTTLADEMGDELEALGRPVAIVSLDAVSQVHPWPPGDPRGDRFALENLASMWPNFRRLGLRYLIVDRVVEHPENLEVLQAAVPEAQIQTLRVTASRATIEARLRVREQGSALAHHLERATELERTLDGMPPPDVTIVNDDRPVADVARDALRALGWPCTRSGGSA